MVSTLFLSLYLVCLFVFSFVSHPVGYCLLLLASSFFMLGWVYYVSGLLWYLLLFCLVYVGGVYILFVFVSLQDPNPSPYCGLGVLSFILILFTFLVSGVGWEIYKIPDVSPDWSRYVCGCYEGLSYILFSLVLVFGFAVLSVVGSSKDCFFR